MSPSSSADQRAEQRPAGDEGAGAVDRVEHPAQPRLRPVQRRTPRRGCRARGSARDSTARIACSAVRSAMVTGLGRLQLGASRCGKRPDHRPATSAAASAPRSAIGRVQRSGVGGRAPRRSALRRRVRAAAPVGVAAPACCAAAAAGAAGRACRSARRGRWARLRPSPAAARVGRQRAQVVDHVGALLVAVMPAKAMRVPGA